jgi:hypothetical protein
MASHVTHLAPLIGDLVGQLPNAELSAQAIIHAQVFGPRSAAGNASGSSITLSGDVSGTGTNLITTTLANVGTAGTYTKVTFNGKGLETSGASAVLNSADFANQGTTTTVLHGNAAGNPSWSAVAVATDIGGLGTGVATALAVNTGTDGAFVVKGGVLGTPSSGTLTHCTGLPIAGNTGEIFAFAADQG